MSQGDPPALPNRPARFSSGRVSPDDGAQTGGPAPKNRATGVNAQAGSVTNSNSVSSNPRASRSPQ